VKGWVIVAGDYAAHAGMDRANLELARFLAAEDPVDLVGHRVADEIGTMPNVKVHLASRPFGKHLLGKPFLAAVGKRWATRLSREGYRVIVNGGNCPFPDVNWVHCVHAAYPASATGGISRRAKTRALHRYNRWGERQAIRSARLIICNSRRTARDVIELLGVEPSRVQVVYLGCDPSGPPINDDSRSVFRKRLGWEDRPWVGFVGQFGNRVKGFDTLYAAWRVLCADSRWDANLAVVGNGTDLSRWIEQSTTDGLSDRIRFLGFRTDVDEIFSACDVVAAPSRYDAYGLAVHEAICRGLPVVVSSAAGVSERIPHELRELILTDPESQLELVERLRHWRRNRGTMVARFRPISEELRSRSWGDMAREIRDAVCRS